MKPPKRTMDADGGGRKDDGGERSEGQAGLLYEAICSSAAVRGTGKAQVKRAGNKLLQFKVRLVCVGRTNRGLKRGVLKEFLINFTSN